MVTTTRNWTEVARELGPTLAGRAAGHDADDSFVTDNYADLKAAGVFSAGVPADLGGGGATVSELGDMLRELAHHCSSTALAVAMHTHLVAVAAWRREHEGASTEGLLRRVASENVVLVSTGATDWLDSSGVLTRVEGGYRYAGRKAFGSGSPAGAILVTSGVFEDPDKGPTVLHFSLPLNGAGVTVQDNWRTIGMRATGSSDILIEDAFVPDAAISGSRRKGAYGVLHTVAMIAIPLVFSVYTGVAEAARDLALSHARKKRELPEVRQAVGEMENQLRIAQMASATALQLAVTARPGPETTREAFIRRTLVEKAAIATVDKAVEVVGGAAFYRATGLERLWRDVQGARFHTLQEKRQLDLTARITLGMSIDSEPSR